MAMHTVRWGDDNILYGAIIGDSNAAAARDFSARVQKVFQEHPGQKINGLIDMRRAGTPDTDALHIFAEIMARPEVGQVAFVGAEAVPRIFAEFVVKFARKDLVRFFNGTDEAIAWLKFK